MKNGKLQIGFIGCGLIANMKHFPALSNLNDMCQMVAFCDLIEERAKNGAMTYGTSDAKTYLDYKELLNDDSIDVVHVLTPNVSHSQITIDALDANKHVLCEKPISHSYKEAMKMVEAAKHTKKKFTIGYQNRFREEVQVLKSACEEGYLGEIYFAKAHAVRRRAVPTWGVFMDKSKQGGGPLIDIGTHALDLTLHFMNNYKPKSITGSVFYKLADKPEGNMFGPWDPKTYEVEDSAFGFIKMEDGATVFLEASWALNTTDTREACTTLCGTNAGAEIKTGPDLKPNLVFNDVKYNKLFETRFSEVPGVAFTNPVGNSPQDKEAKQWLKSILEDTEPLVKPEEALVVTQILDSIYQSSQGKKTIEF